MNAETIERHPSDFFAEVPRGNRHSPPRCWRFDAVAFAASACRTTPFARTLRLDRAFASAAAAQYGCALEFADDSLTRDRSAVLAAVAQNGFAFEFADESLKCNRTVVLAAVAQFGFDDEKKSRGA